VTLLAIGGPARGIVTEGLRYPLRDEELAPGTTRGVSNELVGRSATVGLAAGTLLVVQPHALTDMWGGQ
jgi:thiamine pyrophosphokinase